MGGLTVTPLFCESAHVPVRDPRLAPRPTHAATRVRPPPTWAEGRRNAPPAYTPAAPATSRNSTRSRGVLLAVPSSPQTPSHQYTASSTPPRWKFEAKWGELIRKHTCMKGGQHEYTAEPVHRGQTWAERPKMSTPRKGAGQRRSAR